MKTIAILDNKENKITEALYAHFENKEVSISQINNLTQEDIKSFDLIITHDYNDKISDELADKTNIINIHPSLLPAFQGEAAIVKAYQEGVKVSGVTIHNLISNKIIAQYPVLISNLTNYLEFEAEIRNLEASLITIVAEKILEGKIFDFSDLLGDGCHSGCSGNCGNCH